MTTVDWDGDGQEEILIGAYSGQIWELEHEVSEGEPVFQLKPLIISQTTAAYLEIIDSHRIRLRFALPIQVGVTQVTYSELPLQNGSPLSGKVLVTSKINENKLYLPLLTR